MKRDQWMCRRLMVVAQVLIALEVVALFVVLVRVDYLTQDHEDNDSGPTAVGERWLLSDVKPETQLENRSRSESANYSNEPDAKPKVFQLESPFRATGNKRLSSASSRKREEDERPPSDVNRTRDAEEARNIFYLKVKAWSIHMNTILALFTYTGTCISDPQDRQHDLPQHPQSLRSLAQPEDGTLQIHVRQTLQRHRQARPAF